LIPSGGNYFSSNFGLSEV